MGIHSCYYAIYKILNAMISIPSDNFKPITPKTRGYQSHLQCL